MDTHLSGICGHVAVGILALFALTAEAAPVAVCSEPVYDFGVRADKDVVKHLFRVENRGNKPLVLRAGRVCCGARLTLPMWPVPPGHAVDVRVELTLRGRNGRVNRTLHIHTNDPNLAILRLELTGWVIAISGPSVF